MGWGTGVPSRLLWVELCQRAGLDPLGVVSGHIDLAMKHVLEASTTDPKVRFVSFKTRIAVPGLISSLCARRIVGFRGSELPRDRDAGVYSPTGRVATRDGAAEGGYRRWGVERVDGGRARDLGNARGDDVRRR